MLNQLLIDTRNGVKTIPILLIILVFLGSCNKDKDNYKLILIKIPSQLINPNRTSIVLYELSNDTLIVKENSSFWSKNKLSYVKLNYIERLNIIKKIEEINNNKIDHNYLSNDDGILFSYYIEANRNKQFLFSSIVYSRNYPKEIDSIYYYIDAIVSKKTKLNIPLRDNTLSELKIKSIINKTDTINLSKINSYLIWKELNIGKKELKLNKKGKYNLIFSYWIEYNGNRIKRLTTDNGKLFYVNTGSKTFSFEIDRKISLRKEQPRGP